MSSGNSQQFVFDVEAGKLRKAMSDIAAQITLLDDQIKRMARSNRQLNDQELAQLAELGRQRAKYREELTALSKRWDDYVAGHVKGGRMLTQANRDMNVTFLSLGYAIDDFLTVAQQRNDAIEGIIAGAAAASNNLSVIIAQYAKGPYALLAFVPALVTGIAKITYSINKNSDAAEQWADRIKKASDRLKELQQESEKARMGQAAFGEKQEQLASEKAQQAVSVRIAQLEKQRDEKIQEMLAQYTQTEWQDLTEQQRQEEIFDATRDIQPQINDAKKELADLKQQENARRQRVADQERLERTMNALDQTGIRKTAVDLLAAKAKEGNGADRLKTTLGRSGLLEGIDPKDFDAIANQIVRDAIAEASQKKIKDILEQKGPATRNLEDLRQEQEDDRRKVEDLKFDADGRPNRRNKRKIQEIEAEIRKRQNKIEDAEKAAKSEQERSASPEGIGDKLDDIKGLLKQFLEEQARVPLLPGANGQ